MLDLSQLAAPPGVGQVTGWESEGRLQALSPEVAGELVCAVVRVIIMYMFLIDIFII